MVFVNSDSIPLNDAALTYLEDTLAGVIEAKSAIRQFVPADQENVPLLRSQQAATDSALPNVETSYFNYSPLIDTKTTFSIKRTEMEKLQAGIQNIELDDFEAAANRLITSEEQIFFSGMPNDQLPGIISQLEHPTISLKRDAQSIIDGILKGAILLRSGFVMGPYTLVVGLDFLALTAQIVGDKVLAALLEEEVENELIVSEGFSGALLVPMSSANFVLTRQNEMEVSYLSQDADAYHWLIKNRFAFQLLDNKSGIHFTLE